MNKIYKIKWNKNLKAFVVCSELAKSFGKLSKLVVASSIVLPSITFATDCSPDSNGSYNPGGASAANSTCNNVPASSGTAPISVSQYYVMTDSNLHDTVTIGDVNAVINNGWGGIINRYTSAAYGGAPTIKAGNVTLKMSNSDGNASGLSTQLGVDITAKNVDLAISTTYSGGNSSGGVAVYGVLVGSTVNSGDANAANNGKFTTITMDSLTLNQTTSGGKVLPVLNSGLRAIQGASQDLGNGYSGKIVINNDLNMTLTGARIEGIYISGSASDSAGNEAVSQVILNNSNIKLIGTTTTNNESSAIKLGKARAVGTGKGYLYSAGTMNVDASAAVGDAIKMYETGSMLKADYDTSSTNVIANKSALSINSQDWGISAGTNKANDITVSFNNVNLNTISSTNSLIKVYGNADNFVLNVAGDNSVLNAADSGWLMDVGVASSTASSMIFNGSGGKYFGLTNVADNATLTMNLSGSNTVWYLKKNGTGTTTTVTELTLTDGAILNASGTVTPSSKTITMHDNYTFNVADGDNTVVKALTDNNEFTLVGNVTNTSGVIDLAEDKDVTNITPYVTTLTINGNYIGGDNQPTSSNSLPTGNGKLIVNTIWNNENNSISDRLHVTGTATGYTEVQAKNGIIGDVTRGETEKYSTAVVTVDNHSENSNAFYGFADTTGASQAILVQTDANNYAWYLPTKKVDPEKPVNPTKPEVPAYTLMPRANMELAFNILATLHQRIGEQQTVTWSNGYNLERNSTVWGRFIGNHTKNQGEKRFGYRSDMWGIQFGFDFDSYYDTDNSNRSHSGVMITYAKDNLKFNDKKYVIFDQTIGNYINAKKQTGKGQADIFALGSYYTLYADDGTYMDLVGQLDYTRNKYSSIRSDNVKNYSYGMVLSAEVGRPYAIGNSQWLIEPQAQLAYQYRYFSNFKTFYNVRVAQDNQQALRGRIGFRLAYNQATEASNIQTLYFTGNIIHDFINGRNVKVGTDRVSEKLAKTWGEIGVGLQLPIGTSSYIYSDIRYNHSLTSSKGSRQEYQGNIGIKSHF